MAALLLVSPPPASRSQFTLSIYRNPYRILSFITPLESPCKSSRRAQTQAITFALAESGSEKSLNEAVAILPLLQDLADSLDLPPEYLAQLPRDLRLDLNDAAFDLANGPVIDECGQDVGQTLLNLSRAWEQADTSSSNSIAKQLPSLQNSLADNAKSAFGKRLVSCGKRFQAMGQYGQGELQKIANAMISTGRLLSATPITKTDERQNKETRMFKFGELQVELTPEKAYIGAVISVIFGILNWQLSQGIQSTPESSLEYANDNALLMAKSLRGALILLFYSSTVGSAFASVGLVLLGRQLQSKNES